MLKMDIQACPSFPNSVVFSNWVCQPIEICRPSFFAAPCLVSILFAGDFRRKIELFQFRKIVHGKCNGKLNEENLQIYRKFIEN